VLKQNRGICFYRPARDPRLELRQRMREIAQIRVRFGYRRVHILLRREGFEVGKKLVYRLYREEQLQLRSKRPKRRKMVVGRHARFTASAPGQAWAMDFVTDQLVNGRSLRALTIVDVFSRESLAIEVDHRLRGEHVVAVLNRLVARNGKPAVVLADNGSEFTGRLMDLWAYHHQVRIDFSRPGKPTDNSFIETFNGSLRDECLNVHWFRSLDEAKTIIEAWRIDYNESRPHMAHNGVPPGEFARRHKDLKESPNGRNVEN
jgi:putative transposase